MNQAVAQFAPLVLIMVVFYFLIMRPQQKKFKAHQAMLAALKVGDKVVLAAGFKGKVTRVGEQFFTVDIGQGTKIEVEVERNAISAASIRLRATAQAACCKAKNICFH
ncbi:preprotein translocase subunit YajC [Neisseria meningitidis]|uniref:preprotein translocase subunit YajC n=1 Tax=Neisseria meningitidis TaxID=487 RepID=UPI0005DFC7E5|nr:preprotein translocase subunit YajC [Neisseria meningitidis]CKK19783.1 preprotein translocase subunit YajC [Neisseria meningitidis]